MIKQFPEKASWIEINASAFKHNVEVYRSFITAIPDGLNKKVPLLGCVLKGNAYGHGFVECLSILHDLVELVFVISPLDALKIREYEKENNLSACRVVVLGALSFAEVELCAQNDIEIVIADCSFWEHAFHAPIKVHIHIDTGLGREGFLLENLEKDLSFLASQSHIYVQGVMSHFANTEDVTEQEYAREQVAKLNKASDIIERTLKLSRPLERHIAQSAATFILPESQHDIVRVGISLYGLWSSTETKISAKVALGTLPKLIPVLTWKCESQCVKSIKSGSYIGYGCTYRADRDLRIALFPVGYFDGYPRLLSNKAYVLVHGKRCKVLGRVMMNHIIVDVTEATSDFSPVVATLLGAQGAKFKETISAENLADWAQTINYEIVARIGAHLKRVIV